METTINNQITLSPTTLPVLSKTNAAAFHQAVKERIFETGIGLFEYVELVKFCAALDKQINGDTASKIQPDKEFIDYIRQQVELNSDGKDKSFTTIRGMKFTNAETGTSYDFSSCGDPVLAELEKAEAEAKEAVKARKEMLKTIPTSGMPVLIESTGEMVTIFPPVKTSKSSFKVTLPK